MASEKKIVILGAGYAGVHAAKHLHKQFKNDKSVKVTLINRTPYHTLMTDLHEIAGARVDEDTVKVDLRKVFQGTMVEVVVDEVKEFDFEGQKLTSEESTYEYDYLIMGTGAEPTYFGTPGAEENGFTIWSLDQALVIKEHILEMFKKARFEKSEEKRRQMLTFAVVGAGFTGVEVVGELAEWQHKLCREYEVNPKEVRLMIIEAMPTILPILNENLQGKAAAYMKKLGIEILTGIPITEVGKDLVTLKDGTKIPTKTLIWTAGVQGDSFAFNSGLTPGKRNRVQTNEFMQSMDYKNVYVVGDCGYFEEDGQRGYPQIVEAAEQTAATAVHNLITDMTKNGEKKPFKSNFHGFMVSIGSRYAVANVGGMQMSGFMAMATKHMVNLYYLFGVGGFMLCWHYLMHEFFHIEEKRSILGGHFSSRAHAFWKFPLRIFVGYKWLEQGLAKLPKILADPSHIFLFPAPPAAEGVSAASGAAEAATQAVAAVADAASSATPAADAAGAAAGAAAEAASQFGQALPVPHFISSIMDWFMNTFFYTADGGFTALASVFQAGMVIGEVVVGLCLLAGLFTSFAAVLSIVMGLMIWTSGMAPLEMLWYLTAGVALIGSGRALGLDYYAMPILGRWWRSTKFAKKSYLYVE